MNTVVQVKIWKLHNTLATYRYDMPRKSWNMLVCLIRFEDEQVETHESGEGRQENRAEQVDGLKVDA